MLYLYKLYPEWPLIWAIIAAAISVVLAILQSSNRKGKKTWLYLSILTLTILIICLTIISIVLNKVCTIVPQLSGITIEDATNRIYTSNLDPEYLVSEKNEQGEYVVWQEPSAGSLVKKHTPVFFVSRVSPISPDVAPLTYFDEQKAIHPVDEQIELLPYYIDENYITEGADRYYNEPHLEIQISAPEKHYNFVTYRLADGRSVFYSDTTDWNMNFTNRVACTLEEITEDMLTSIGILNPIENYKYIGMLSDEECNTYSWKKIATSSWNGTIFLPEHIEYRRYKFKFCFYDNKNDACYSWYHYVTIIPCE